MAWLALYNWYHEWSNRSIFKINMINWYSDKLYDDWYSSLTDEQKEYLKKKREEKYKKDIFNFASLMYYMANMSGKYDMYKW